MFQGSFISNWVSFILQENQKDQQAFRAQVQDSKIRPSPSDITEPESIRDKLKTANDK
jgi:hypothetical protein